MKLVTYRTQKAEETKLGVWLDDGVLDLSATPDASLASMASFLDGGAEALAAAQRAVEQGASALIASDQCVLCPPVPKPPKLFCLAGNYAAHIREGGGESPGRENTTPRVFMKPPTTTLIASGESILIPRGAGWIDWEAELAVIIGKGGKYISAADAYGHVAGYTVMNDVSERRLPVPDTRTPREGDSWFDWLNGKWFDTFAPLGPVMVTSDEIPDPHTLGISLRVNGDTKQDASTGDMIFSVAELIEFISGMVTLEPGDIISTGTPEGTGIARGEKLKDGDIVEVEIEKIGILKNPVKQD